MNEAELLAGMEEEMMCPECGDDHGGHLAGCVRGKCIVAVLSSTVLTEGTFECRLVKFDELDLKNVQSFVGHPDTRVLLERLGTVHTPGLFAGLEAGESFVAVPLANPDRKSGWTVDQAVQDIGQLAAKLVTRLK